MTYAEVGPFVVQCHDDAFATAHNIAHFIERKHALIDPMQVHDVCLLELIRVCYADANIGDVCLP